MAPRNRGVPSHLDIIIQGYRLFLRAIIGEPPGADEKRTGILPSLNDFRRNFEDDAGWVGDLPGRGAH